MEKKLSNDNAYKNLNKIEDVLVTVIAFLEPFVSCPFPMSAFLHQTSKLN